MTDQPKRRTAPRGAPEEQAAALRAKLLVELGKHNNRTTLQLAEILELDRQVVYRSLLSMERRGEVDSFTDRRNTPNGALNKVWAINGEKKVAEPRPPRDPLLWALFAKPMETS